MRRRIKYPKKIKDAEVDEMKKIAIMTDSNSGITQEQGKELGVFVIPMPFMINGETLFEGINLTQEDFFRQLSEGEEIQHFPAISGRCDGDVG